MMPEINTMNFIIIIVLCWHSCSIDVAFAAPPMPRNIRQAFVQLSTQLHPDYVQAISAYHRLERNLPKEELRSLVAIGLLNGARQAEQKMEDQLVVEMKELLAYANEPDGMMNHPEVIPKIQQIEEQLMRDQRAVDILTSTMDLMTTHHPHHHQHQSEASYRSQMRKSLQQYHNKQHPDGSIASTTVKSMPLNKRLSTLRHHIQDQVPNMKTNLDSKIEQTLEHLMDVAPKDGLLAKAKYCKILHKRDVSEPHEEPPEIHVIKSILSEADFQDNLVVQQFEKRQVGKSSTQSYNNKKKNQESIKNSTDVNNQNHNNHNEDDDNDNNNEIGINFDSAYITASERSNNVTMTTTAMTPKVRDDDMKAKQEDDTTDLSELPDIPENPDGGGDGDGGGGGGGLVGLIGSLSGGEGGSDIGALIGALTGLISTIFGPGGLDIEALISTSTSLLAGLLAGNKNFGTVLGQYVGTAFDGVSGGGGAILTGQFFGNFLGTVFASLSADPEEEGGPQPFVFAQNLLSSFLEAKNRPPATDGSEERHGSVEVLPARQMKKEAAAGGSDSNSFVQQIVSHVVSSVLGLILNASLGASGGVFQASSGIFASSSASSQHLKPAALVLHRKSWIIE